VTLHYSLRLVRVCEPVFLLVRAHRPGLEVELDSVVCDPAWEVEYEIFAGTLFPMKHTSKIHKTAEKDNLPECQI